jgi:hypothetical protein
MNQLHEAVVRHLEAQRDSARAVKLWNELWEAFERGGGVGLAQRLEERAELPESADGEDAS